jgi:hypothetical protein
MVTDLIRDQLEQTLGHALERTSEEGDSRAEASARFWATVDDGPDRVAGGARVDVDAWEAKLDEEYRAALETDDLDAAVADVGWITALDDWERWPPVKPFGSRGRLLLNSEL